MALVDILKRRVRASKDDPMGQGSDPEQTLSESEVGNSGLNIRGDSSSDASDDTETEEEEGFEQDQDGSSSVNPLRLT